MRILIITTQDRFFLSHIRERAVYFKEQGCSVGVAAQKTSEELVRQINNYGFTFFDTKIERRAINPFSQVNALYRLYKIQRKFNPDFSYHLGAKAIFYGTFTSRLNNPKVKVVNAPIGLGYIFASNTIKARLLRPIALFLYKLFLNPSNSKVIIENFDDIDFFIKKGCLRPKDSYCILGAGVDTNHFSPLPYTKRNEICTVVMAARLIREKGVFDFVNAASLLYKHKVPVKMQLIGTPDFGNPSSITQEEFELIKRNPAIECLGYHSDISPYLQKAHICCLPSFYKEGLPRVLIEGASSGLAIITTDITGCRESLRDNNGFLIKPHDIKKLAYDIEYLVTHPHDLKRMGESSRKVALSYFDTKIICKRTFDIFKTLSLPASKND